MNAVVVGPGRIGCGLAGHLLARAGYAVTFLGRGRGLALLADAGRYHVELTDGRRTVRETVEVAAAIDTADLAAAAAALAAADLVVVSVGAGNLAAVGPLLAAGLGARTRPVDVIAMENLADAGARLAAAVRPHLPPGAPDHGFTGAVVSRIVARRVALHGSGRPATFVADFPDQVVVHGPSLRTALPPIPGLKAVDDFEAWFARKLFTFSAGHASAAYLGALKGYRFVHAAVRDREIRHHVLAAMEEGRRGLEGRYGAEVAGTPADLEAILARFENATLNDPVERVARDPVRKLGQDDRLVGAAQLAERAGVKPRWLALSAAAALCFTGVADPSAAALQDALEARGVGHALRSVSGLDAEDGLGRIVAERFAQLAPRRDQGAVLLSLDHPQWTWARGAAAARRAA